MAPPRLLAPQAVLFACGLNSVRSPMAQSLLQQMFPHALYVKSAGVRKGELDPFAVAVMAELGHDISGHKSTTFEELDDWEGLNFDLIITLSPEAHHKALELTRTLAAEVEYWPTHDPTGADGNREQKLQAYREVCDTLSMRIRKRFSKVGAASGRSFPLPLAGEGAEQREAVGGSLGESQCRESPHRNPPPQARER